MMMLGKRRRGAVQAEAADENINSRNQAQMFDEN